MLRTILRPSIRSALLALVLSTALGTASASAAFSPEQFGVNVQMQGSTMPTDLALGSASGLGSGRVEMIAAGSSGQLNTSYADSVVKLLAAAHMRLQPILGLPTQQSPSAAASAMVNYVQAFATRYGPGGAFWSQNKSLPYEPVQMYEIGDEPNIPLRWINDKTNLHWSDPSAYALVYAAARDALHSVDSAGIAVVGGLADSAYGGTSADAVDLWSAERWLAALTGPVDAVGFHPYTWQSPSGLAAGLAQMRSDLAGLRGWMNANGMASTPIELNEYGACDVQSGTTTNTKCTPSMSSHDWGLFAAGYTTWAFCTPGLGVQSVDPFYWGDIPSTDTDAFLAFVSSGGVLTPYGQYYLDAVHTLTTSGCPPSSGPGSGAGGGPGGGAAGQPSGLRLAHLRLLRIRIHGSRLTVTIRVTRGTYRVVVTAVRGRHRIRLHLIMRRQRGALLTFRARLPRGRWAITVRCRPPAGYLAAPPLHRTVRLRR